MPIQPEVAEQIREVLRISIRTKLRTYRPESTSMPFHTRLLGTGRMALYSFIHSFNTNFGTTIFETVAKQIALTHFERVERSAIAGSSISEEAQKQIQIIMNSLTNASALPNKANELQILRQVCQMGEMRSVKLTQVDLLIEDNNVFYLFDIKTAKPNIGNFKEFKRTLLEW